MPTKNNFHPGDYVEFDSTAKKAVHHGVIAAIGYIGNDHQTPVLVAFVQCQKDKTPLLVSAHRLRPCTWPSVYARQGDAA